MSGIVKTWETYWSHWEKFVQPLGMDSFLQGVTYTDHVCLLTGFAACVCTGDGDHEHQVTTHTISTVHTAIGQTISLAIGTNPT